MKAGIYIRVSTEEQVTEGFSISAQREKLKAYCISQNWTASEFYVDEGISAKDTNRPQLQRMINDIKENKIDIVLVYRLDRLTRSVLDLYNLLAMFEKYNCNFKSATEVYDTTTAMGRLFITLVAALAQWERENLGERVRMGQIEKARQGQYAAKAPFGYDKDEKHKLIVNDDEKRIVLDMIGKVKEGCSIRQLAKYLDNTTPPIRGYKWHIRTILDILHNHALYGAVRWSDSITKDAHEPIISEEEFEHLQKILYSRQNFKKRHIDSTHIFQMKIICPNCGNRLGCEKSIYYRKSDKKQVVSKHYRCQPCALNGRKAVATSETKIEAALLEYTKNTEFEVDPGEEEVIDQSNELKEHQMKLNQIEKQREKYQKAWSMDLITDKEFSERMNETLSVYEDIKKKISTFQPVEKQEVDAEQRKVILQNFNLNWNDLTEEEKKEFLNTFIDGIEFVKNESTVTVTGVRLY